jgi:hypothetical protein
MTAILSQFVLIAQHEAKPALFQLLSAQAQSMS